MWKGLKVVAAGSVLTGLSAAPLWAQAPERYYDYHMMGGWGGMLFGPLMLILTIAVIAVVVVLAVRWLGSVGQPAANSPLDILKERFARGEINREEYEERRKVLQP